MSVLGVAALGVVPDQLRPAGQELRLRQEFFFVSASLQDIIRRHISLHGDLSSLPEHACLQLNDTHPAMAVAYGFPISLQSDMQAFITGGADGEIPDVDFPIVAPADTQTKIQELAAVVNSRDDVYMATAADDPLHPVVDGYSLKVVT